MMCLLALLDSRLVTGALDGRGSLSLGPASSVMPMATLRLAFCLALTKTCTCGNISEFLNVIIITMYSVE